VVGDGSVIEPVTTGSSSTGWPETTTVTDCVTPTTMAAEASPAFSSFGCGADASLVVLFSVVGSAAGAAMAPLCAGSSIAASVSPGR
jgi:hypothetical protein